MSLIFHLHNLIKRPCRLHEVVPEVGEVDAEVSQRVLDAEVFCRRIHFARC